MGRALSKADNFWLCMDEPVNLMVITGFMVFDEPIAYRRLQATLENRLLSNFHRFRERVVQPTTRLGLPHWQTDAHFDIRSHLHRIALPDPGGKHELQTLIGSLTTMPLDMSKPPWQAHLIENYGSGCVVFFRIHHCIADGIALIHVLLSMADSDPDAPAAEPSDMFRPRKPFRLQSLIPIEAIKSRIADMTARTRKLSRRLTKELTSALSNPAHAVELAQLAGGLSSDVASLLAKLTTMPSDPSSPFKGKMGVHKSVAWTEPIALDRVKQVGKAIDTSTLNDVLIATVTGAMRRYLITRNYRVNTLDLRVTVPVNIRKPGTEFQLGNRFSLVFLALPVYIEDPVLRLKEVKRRMDKLKQGPDAYVGYGLLNTLGLLPAEIAKQAALVFGNKASGVLTNVPGPRQPLYFAGQKIQNMMFWVPRSGQVGLGISILSYDGKITVGIAADSGRMPDPQVLLEGFEEEFNSLLDLVQSGKIYEPPLVLHDRYRESRCQATTRKGRGCKNRAAAGSKFCHVHAAQDGS